MVVGEVEARSDLLPANSILVHGMWLEHGTPHRHMWEFRRRHFGINGRLLCPQVIDIRPRPLLWLAHPHGLASDQLRDLGSRIVHVTGDNGAFGTDHDTGWFQSHFGAVGAVVALGGGMAVGVDVERVVGARLHTRLAADAARVVEVDDAIRSLIERPGGTDGHTGSIVTVVAAVDQEIAARVGELALLDVFHPRAVYPYGNIVLGFTCHSAGVAADALALVNDKCILRQTCFPFIYQEKPG